VILEIGCFDAGFLSEIAAKNPGTAFIGIDWKCKAIYDGAKRIAEGKLKNIVLLRTRAQDLGLIFAEAELDEIWIFHPDPCDKEAELKNRLVSEGFLFEAHRVLRDRASLLALKTDHADYYRSVIESFSATPANGMEISVASKDYWNDPPAVAHTASRLFAGNTTLFERRFIKRREPIHYVEFRKAIGFQIVKICRS
jgi:tRNA G46 methylase TrmB